MRQDNRTSIVNHIRSGGYLTPLESCENDIDMLMVAVIAFVVGGVFGYFIRWAVVAI